MQSDEETNSTDRKAYIGRMLCRWVISSSSRICRVPVEQGLTSHSTQFRSFPRRCLKGLMTKHYNTILLLENSSGNIPSCAWPNHSSDVVKWSSRGTLLCATGKKTGEVHISTYSSSHRRHVVLTTNSWHLNSSPLKLSWFPVSLMSFIMQTIGCRLWCRLNNQQRINIQCTIE